VEKRQRFLFAFQFSGTTPSYPCIYQYAGAAFRFNYEVFKLATTMLTQGENAAAIIHASKQKNRSDNLLENYRFCRSIPSHIAPLFLSANID